MEPRDQKINKQSDKVINKNRHFLKHFTTFNPSLKRITGIIRGLTIKICSKNGVLAGVFELFLWFLVRFFSFFYHIELSYDRQEHSFFLRIRRFA